MSRTISRAKHLLRIDGGQTMAEYALVLAVVASASIFLYPVLGSRVIDVVNEVTGLLS